MGRALKRSWGSFNWACAAGRAGMRLEPALGCELKTSSLPSNSSTGVVGPSSPPPPFLCLLYSPHHWPCFNKAPSIHIHPARKSRKLAAPVDSG